MITYRATIITCLFILGIIGGYVIASPRDVPQSVIISQSDNAIVGITMNVVRDGIQGGSLGTGFFIDENTIITNNHVIEGGTNLKVFSKNLDKDYDAEVKWTDPAADIAVIQLKDWKKYKEDNPDVRYLKFDTTYEQGDPITVIGHPSGLMYAASRGIISIPGKRVVPNRPSYYIGTDAHLYEGNSGGPMIDADGEVIGVNDMMFVVNGGSYGFAIPAKVVMKVLSDFKKYGEVRWAMLGINIKKNVISEVTPGSAAEKAGLKAGDTILRVAIGDESIAFRTPEDLLILLSTIDYKDEVLLALEDRNVKVSPGYRTSKDFAETK